jgi:hypothetical protein
MRRPAPADYETGEPLDQPTLALGLLLDASASTPFACTSLATGAPPGNEAQAKAFIRALDHGEAVERRRSNLALGKERLMGSLLFSRLNYCWRLVATEGALRYFSLGGFALWAFVFPP